jgi:hypothetical protein
VSGVERAGAGAVERADVATLASIARHWPPLSPGIPALTQQQGKDLLQYVSELQDQHADLLAALEAVIARLDQPVLRGDEKAGNQTANILRADINSALSVARAAIARATGVSA